VIPAGTRYFLPSREQVRDIQVLIPNQGSTHLIMENMTKITSRKESIDRIVSLFDGSI